MGRRKGKGEVSIDNDKGKIRLRWRFNSERYSLNLSFPYKRSYIIDAKKIAECIENDINSTQFDLSLQKYKNFNATNALPPSIIIQPIESASRISTISKQDLLVQEIVSSSDKQVDNSSKKRWAEVDLTK